MRDFQKLIAWQKAHAFAIAAHREAPPAGFRSAPGLRSQLLRAANSISSNIAEGAGKRTDGEFARYLDIALGSAREVDNQLMLARALQCVDSLTADKLLVDLDEVKRILYALARAVRRRMGGV